ncbi:Mettl23 [Symbiodinium natans]|uniref:Mettl23 protein n=1 Tax=Symbiodinium natans TaxID=878477 RepID=A0A812TK87_9DINO|nr:Mettl23 [Symbiodinium natans]
MLHMRSIAQRPRSLLLSACALAALSAALSATSFGWAAAGFDPGPPRAKPSKSVKKLKKSRGRGFGPAPAASGASAGPVTREEKRRQQRLGKDPSMNDARKILLSQMAEQRFAVGEVDVDLVIPAYVLDLNRFAREVESGAGTVSDIVWPAEQVLAQTLLQRKELWQARGLCEIGAGLGLAGIAAAKSGAPHVLLSDRDALVLDLSKQSAQRNGVAERVTFAAFDWSDKDSWPKPFGGMTAAADVLYDKQVVAWLVDLIVHFAGPALLVEPDNVERRQLGSVPYFEEVARSRGLAVTTESCLNPSQPSSPMLLISINQAVDTSR